MHPSHVQWKICRWECLQDIMHGNRINKSELELYSINNKIQEFITSWHSFKDFILTRISSYLGEFLIFFILNYVRSSLLWVQSTMLDLCSLESIYMMIESFLKVLGWNHVVGVRFLFHINFLDANVNTCLYVNTWFLDIGEFIEHTCFGFNIRYLVGEWPFVFSRTKMERRICCWH